MCLGRRLYVLVAGWAVSFGQACLPLKLYVMHAVGCLPWQQHKRTLTEELLAVAELICLSCDLTEHDKREASLPQNAAMRDPCQCLFDVRADTQHPQLPLTAPESLESQSPFKASPGRIGAHDVCAAFYNAFIGLADCPSGKASTNGRLSVWGELLCLAANTKVGQVPAVISSGCLITNSSCFGGCVHQCCKLHATATC